MSFSLSLMQALNDVTPLQAEFSVVTIFPGELNLQWDFSILFLKFLSPSFFDTNSLIALLLR